MKLAQKLAREDKELKVALKELKENFWAPSTKASREIKRSEVVSLARSVAGTHGVVFPLNQRVV